MTKRVWTDQRLNRALELRAKGHTNEEIAELVGSSVGAISHQFWLHDHAGPAEDPTKRTNSRGFIYHTPKVERFVEKPIDPEELAAGITMEKLKHHQCRWPLGDPQTPEFRLCGQPRVSESYCRRHQKQATPKKPG